MATIDVDSLPGFREPFNCFSHLMAAIVFTYMTPKVIQRGQGDFGKMLAFFVFGFTSVFLLLMSGIYHMLWPGGGREVMERMDIAAILVLLRGRSLPFL